MSRYIDAELIIPDICEDIYCETCPFFNKQKFETGAGLQRSCLLIERIKSIPDADVQPVVHGEKCVFVIGDTVFEDECAVYSYRELTGDNTKAHKRQVYTQKDVEKLCVDEYAPKIPCKNCGIGVYERVGSEMWCCTCGAKMDEKSEA